MKTLSKGKYAMFDRRIFQFITFTALTLSAQMINLRGMVSNRAGKPISDAVVELVKQQLKDTTGSDGTYHISSSTASVSPIFLLPYTKSIVINKGFLEYSLPETSPLKIEIYSINGALLKSELLWNASPGFYRFNIEENFRAASLLVIRTAIGQDEFTFRYLPLHSGRSSLSRTAVSAAVRGKWAKIAAVNDTLKVTAANYTAKTIAITSYDQELNITLDTAGAAGRSAGCGKNPTLAGGSHTIQSGGQSRSFMLRLPPNYDKNHPYPLVFAFHWVGGTMGDVDGGGDDGAKTWTKGEVWKFFTQF